MCRSVEITSVEKLEREAVCRSSACTSLIEKLPYDIHMCMISGVTVLGLEPKPRVPISTAVPNGYCGSQKVPRVSGVHPSRPGTVPALVISGERWCVSSILGCLEYNYLRLEISNKVRHS